jgi:omega-6 fatty acid desaturase (delta-12 desaturase)
MRRTALCSAEWTAELLGTVLMLPSMNMYRLWSHGHNRVHHGFTSYTPVDWIWRSLTPELYAAKSRWGRAVYRLGRNPLTCALPYLLRV